MCRHHARLAGHRESTGWDFGQVDQGTTNDYLITTPLQAGNIFTATLTWFRDRQHGRHHELHRRKLTTTWIWNCGARSAALPTKLISASNSLYNNTEHFTFAIPATGQYMLRVRWTEEMFDIVGDLNIEQYGLAWSTTSVPEPAAFLLLLMADAVPAVRSPAC